MERILLETSELRGLICLYLPIIREKQYVSRLGKRPRITPTFVATELYRAGQLQSDSEIFDFTDSRFIRPPAESVRNFPTISLEEEVGNAVPAGVLNNEPYLGAGSLAIHHQSVPTNNQVKD